MIGWLRLTPAVLRTPGEDQRAEAVTVAWTLAMLAALLFQVAAVVAWFASGRNQPPADINLSALLLFTAIVAGLVCLILLPIAHYVRRRRPPLAISIFAAVGSPSPWLLQTALR